MPRKAVSRRGTVKSWVVYSKGEWKRHHTSTMESNEAGRVDGGRV
jgi:hypothetical protein